MPGLSRHWGACLTIGFLLLQWRATSLREEHSEWRTSTLELETAKAKAELGTAQADIAKANAQIAGANETAAKANERSAELARETETLRATNLEMEKAFSPPELSFTSEDRDRLRSFGKVRWTILFTERDEPRDTASQITFLLNQAEWVHFEGQIPDRPFAMEGSIYI